jgi:hypothetical protein
MHSPRNGPLAETPIAPAVRLDRGRILTATRSRWGAPCRGPRPGRITFLGNGHRGLRRAKAALVPDLTGRLDIKLNRQLKLPVSRLVLMWLQPRGD